MGKRQAETERSKLSKRAKRQRVTLDQLKWSAVDVPDNLDDYEGLCGLEEVDDVDIIRENGRVTFHAKNETPSDVKESEDEDEWEGFSDDHFESQTHPDTGADTDSVSKGSVSENGAQERPDKSARGLTAIGFSALDEEALEDGVDTSEWQFLDLSPDVRSSLSP